MDAPTREDTLGQLVLEQLDSARQIRREAQAWDALWRRSDVTLPTTRANLVALWLDCFAPKAPFRALVVRQQGRLVAALPLAERRYRRIVPVGDLTGNCWSPNGEFLIDPEVDAPAVVQLLAGALDRLPWPLVWLEMVPFQTERWQALLRALIDRGFVVDLHPRYRIGQVELSGSVRDYEASRSKNLRRSLRKDLQRLEADGPVAWKHYPKLAPQEVEEPLRRAFEIDRRSWKQAAGGAVLDTPGIFEFYRRQARQLAEWGYLGMAFLEHRGRPIAFEMGWTAKGVYHSFKVGYDQSYRRVGPGHLLRKHLIETLFDDPQTRLIDFQGPVTQALASWSTRSYAIGRVVVAPRRLPSRVLLTGYRTLATAVRRFRRPSTRC